MADIPRNVQALLSGYVRSIDQLYILLLLHGTPNKEWSVPDVSRVLAASPGSAGVCLQNLASNSILGTTGDGEEQGYRYHPTNPEIGDAVGALAKVYSQCGVLKTLISNLEQ